MILSEQGFGAEGKNGEDLEEMQAAAIMAAYYKVEADPNIDLFGYHRLKDHAYECGDDGPLKIGLYKISDEYITEFFSLDPESARSTWATKTYASMEHYVERLSCSAFRCMDTPDYKNYDQLAKIYDETFESWDSYRKSLENN